MRVEALYVASGVNGIVKIGRTSNPIARQGCLRRDFKLLGDELYSFQSTDFICFYASQEEKQLIEFVRSIDGCEPVYGREYFKGVDAGQCIQKAKEIAAKSLEEIRKKQEIEKREQAERRLIAEKRARSKEEKMEALKKKHFEEFLEKQRTGLLPIPDVTNAAAS